MVQVWIKSQKIKEVKLIHKDEGELYSDDEDGDDSFLFLAQGALQTMSAIVYLSTPLIMKIVELRNASISSIVWISSEAMKQNAVTGRKLVKLYPYMHISYVYDDLRPLLKPNLRISWPW
mgnify:CR=1 FL=1